MCYNCFCLKRLFKMELKIGERLSCALQAFKGYLGYGESLPEEILKKSLFSADWILPKTASTPLSGHSMGSSFVVSDYTSLYRSFHDALLNTIGVCSGSHGWFKEFLTGGNVSFGYQAFGSATGLNAVIGAIQVIQATRGIDFAESIGDSRAFLMERINVLKGASLSGAGVSFAVFRPLGMVEAIKTTPSLIGKVSLGFASAGTIFYAFFFIFISAVFGIKLYEDVKFRQQLNQAKSLEEVVEFFQKKATVDPKKSV